MERVAQWLDELDDLIAAMGLLSERLRNFFLLLSFLVVSLSAQFAAVALALRHVGRWPDNRLHPDRD